MSSSAQKTPLLRWPALLIVMLSLSIGWGIRGNYGHEFGAMMPGMFAAIAVSLLSGRADWRQRVLFFAFFGALGWGFGGSISYMPTMAYTQSGQWATQVYGWVTVFVVGFLWAGMGGAGTAYAAVESRERITALFRPLCFVMAAWAVEYILQANRGDFRQRDPLYWLDSQWMSANWTLAGLFVWELWDRRLRRTQWLTVCAAAGAAVGWMVQTALQATGMAQSLVNLLVRPQGDLSAINPATGRPFDPNDLVTNWPQLFINLGPHLGWFIGLMLGIAFFFLWFGKWRSGSSLILYITLGSYIVFLLGPVLLTPLFSSVGGFRMTPPRGDSWANIVGCFAGMMIYMRRNGLKPVGYAAVVAGVIGGLGFMAAQLAKILLITPGNPAFSQNPLWLRQWQHWHSANWHNIAVEQGVGLLYGLAIVLAMAMLANRLKPPAAEPPIRYWTAAFSVFFLLVVLLYVNLVKNVPDWTRVYGTHAALPSTMKAPLFPAIELSALAWFNITFLLMGLCLVAILWAHHRRPLAIVPPGWVGRGQFLYLIFLWAILIGNWEKALPGFQEQRLATEWVMMVNGLIVTFLLLHFGRDDETAPPPSMTAFQPVVRRALRIAVAGIVVGVFGFTAVHHALYHGKPDGFGGRNLRFGPDADWRVRPTLKNKAHS